MGIAPWVPTFGKDLKRVFKLVGKPRNRIFIDLGCGNGKVVMWAAKKGFQAHGIELSLPLYIFCRLRQALNPKLRVKFHFGNLLGHDISNADIIYLFALPRTLSEKFVEKLLSSAKPGLTIVSYCFELANLKPTRVGRESDKDLPIYIYKI